LGEDGLSATIESPSGRAEVTAVLPRPPSSITVDGEAVEFEFTTPDRVARFAIDTGSFEGEQAPGTLWTRLERAIAGGPPGLTAEFDRGWFMPDARAPQGEPQWRASGGSASPVQAAGLTPGVFVRLRGEFQAEGRAEVSIASSTDPALVFVNGEFVTGLSGSGASRRADITPLMAPGGNEISLVIQIAPRELGLSGLHHTGPLLPTVVISGDEGEIQPESWDVRTLLAGEREGWMRQSYDHDDWHFIRFGPWREQGSDLAGVRGVGWYRAPFDLPEPGAWNLRYRLGLTLQSAGVVYLNGSRLATCDGEGRYVLPLTEPPLRGGDTNTAALALYGLAPQTGLHRLDVTADLGQLTRNHVLRVQF
jgi:hypothetical protein